WRSCSARVSSARRRSPSSISASTRATTMPTLTRPCGVGGTWDTFGGAARNAAAVGVESGPGDGSSSARTRGSTAAASCLFAGKRNRRITSRSYSSPPLSWCSDLWDRLLERHYMERDASRSISSRVTLSLSLEDARKSETWHIDHNPHCPRSLVG